jgi:hypothetical protein
MVRILCIILFLSIGLFASSFKINEKITHFSLVNQFDEKQTVTDEIEILLVSFEKGTGADVNEFLANQKSDFLKEHHAIFIANISGMPMVITKMFALPKMRKYQHNILLIYDENDTRFQSKEGKTTLYRLKNGIIHNIEFITKDDLSAVFE